MQRLHQQLVAEGHDSRFLIGRPHQSNPPLVEYIGDSVSEFATKFDGLMSRFGNQFEDLWGMHPWARRPTLKLPRTEIYQWADLIDLRNLFGDYFNLWVLPAISAHKPVVWRLPDMWALTGHCAYPYDCQRWIEGCYDCPLLSGEGRKIVEPPPTKWDGTKRVWRAKKGIYSHSSLHIVVTTQWMKNNVQKSILGDALSINIISNGVNLQQYKPYSKVEVRRALNIPLEQHVLLFAAAELNNHRKGYAQTIAAVKKLHQRMEDPPLLITMGSAESVEEEPGIVRHFGFVGEAKRQAQLYAAADLFLCTTLADAQPQTALESIACGTPIIAFDVGPMADITGKGAYGFIAPHLSGESLSETIASALSQPDLLSEMGENCRHKAERDFDLVRQTEKYIELYEKILSRYSTPAL